MAKKRKNFNATTKVSPPPHVAPPDKSLNAQPFHLLFPVELHHTDKGEKKICWFKDDFDLKKYVVRYKLKPKEYTIQKTKPKK